MPRQTHKCLAECGRIITWRFAICAECEKKYGRSPKQWPSWLAYRWNDEQRLRRQAERIRSHEVTFVDLPSSVALDDRYELEECNDD